MSNQWYDIDIAQWVDDPTYEWGFSVDVQYLNQIFTDDSFVYVATTSGLEIVDIETELSYSFSMCTDGYSTVWASDYNVYLGTTSSGVKVLPKTSITYGDLSVSIVDYVSEPDLTSNNIRYIHGNETKLICCTKDGVDIIRRDTHYITHCYVGNTTKCFVTPSYDYYYYISNSLNATHINRLNQNKSDWTTPDIIYTTEERFLYDVTEINDIYVTEHTSTSENEDNNSIFIATNAGALVYDEGTFSRLLITNSGIGV